jgi:FkbM family methyltransferase
MRATPHALRGAMYYRWFKPRIGRYVTLFESASLEYAPGMRMYDLVPTDYISQCIAFMGFFELSLTKRIAHVAKRGGMFVDVGANMGYFSLLWLQHSGNRVVAFEPVPRNCERLRLNFQNNGCADRVRLLQAACGDAPGELKLDLGPEAQTGWGSLAVGDASRCIDVDVCRVDDVLGGDERIAIMKIDTEGADPLVLRGCEKLLRRHMIDELYFEQNLEGMSRLGLAPDEPMELLKSHGYTVTCCDNPAARVSTWMARPAKS